MNEQAKENFANEKITDINIKLQIEIEAASGDASKCFAIGYNYADILQNKPQKEIMKTFHCNGSSANAIVQGVKGKNLENKFGKGNSSTDNATIAEEINKIKIGEQQAAYGIIGRNYSDFFNQLSYKEICEKFDLKPTESPAYWISTGVNSLDYKKEEQDIELKRIERVTFHSNYTYSQFVGTFKPHVINVDGKDEITYKYIPGPFMRVYKNAILNQDKDFLLIIEEINRANVAAVFGDVFQLLDRFGQNGDENHEHAFESEYPINASEDLKKFLLENNINDNELRIPSNMYIWATMNSADQGVLPMDAAFKRRWDFEYIGIDDGEKDENGNENQIFASYTLPIPIQYDSNTKMVTQYSPISWNEIRHAINNKLKLISGVNEDKLLGPYFLSKSTLESSTNASDIDEQNKICSLFKSKVLMYLYEDVVKMNPTELFNEEIFDEGKPLHYSDLCLKFDEIGLEIFNKDFVKKDETNI